LSQFNFSTLLGKITLFLIFISHVTTFLFLYRR
jgi:hypothetical protein